MPRLISMAYTAEQVRARTKTVTRRVGWVNARPGERLIACEKVMGRKAGEPLVRIVAIELVDVRREPIMALVDNRRGYGDEEVSLEGFPDLSPETFVRTYFTEAQGLNLDAEVTRLAYRYLEGHCLRCAGPAGGCGHMGPGLF